MGCVSSKKEAAPASYTVLNAPQPLPESPQRQGSAGTVMKQEQDSVTERPYTQPAASDEIDLAAGKIVLDEVLSSADDDAAGQLVDSVLHDAQEEVVAEERNKESESFIEDVIQKALEDIGFDAFVDAFVDEIVDDAVRGDEWKAEPNLKGNLADAVGNAVQNVKQAVAGLFSRRPGPEGALARGPV